MRSISIDDASKSTGNAITERSLEREGAPNAPRGQTMRIDVITLFPEMIGHAVSFGIAGRAKQRGLWELATWNPRDFTSDPHRTVDDRPYGGGPGMVMLAE